MGTRRLVVAFSFAAAAFALPRPAAASPCAIRVTAPAAGVLAPQCSPAEAASDPRALIGYAHAGEAYVAVARSGKWLKIDFNGGEGWIAAVAVAEAPGTPALRFPSARPVRGAEDPAGATVYGAVPADALHAVLEDGGARSRVFWGGGAVWVDSDDAARLAIDGALDERLPARAPVDWDPCLDMHKVKFVPGGGPWKLIRAEVRLDTYADRNCTDTGPLCPNKLGAVMSGGNINIVVTCLDEGGAILCAPAVTPLVKWTGNTVALTNCKAGEPVNKYSGDFPMYGGQYPHCDTGGPFSCTIDPASNGGQTSDTVTGMGLPAGHHHSFHLTFQRGAVTTPPPPPGPGPTPPPSGGPTGDPVVLADGTLHWEAEDYTGGSSAAPGVDFSDTTPQNIGGKYRTQAVDIESCSEGGFDVGWTNPGEWMRYRFTGGGTYQVLVREAGLSGGTVHVEIDGVSVSGPLALPATGDWQKWTTVTGKTFSVASGSHTVRFVEDSSGFNVNWFRFKPATPPPSPAPKPDLVMDAVTASPAAPAAGQAVSFSAVVRNAGGASVPSGVSIRVAFSVDGAAAGSASAAGPLAAGASVTVTAPNAWTAAPGTHGVVARADDAGAVDESNETNNAGSTSVSVGGGAPPPSTTVTIVNSSFESGLVPWSLWSGTGSNGDGLERDLGGAADGAYVLAVKGIGAGGKGAFQYVPSGWVEGRSYRLAVAVRNIANAGLRYSIGFQPGNAGAAGAASATYGLPVAGSSAWQTASVDLTVGGSGGVTIYLRAVNAGSAERAGFDRVTASELGGGPPAPAPKPDLLVESLTADPPNPFLGQGVVLSALVRNAGQADVPAGATIRVTFGLNGGAPVAGSAAGPLAAGAGVVVKAAAPLGAVAGTNAFTARADDPDAIAESDETNNARTLTLAVGGDSPPPAVPDGSFETGVAPWALWTGAGSNGDYPERDFRIAADGDWSLGVKGIGAGGKGVFLHIPSGWMDGRAYRLTASVRNVANSGMTYSIGYRLGNPGAAGAANATFGAPVAGTSTWQRASVDFTYGGGQGVTIYLRVVNAGASERAGFDRVVVEVPPAASGGGQPAVTVQSVGTSPSSKRQKSGGVTVTAVVRNTGTAPVPAGATIRVTFTSGGAAVAEGTTTGPLAPGEATTVTATVDAADAAGIDGKAEVEGAELAGGDVVSSAGGPGGGGGGRCFVSGSGVDAAGWAVLGLGAALAWVAARRRRKGATCAPRPRSSSPRDASTVRPAQYADLSALEVGK